MGFEGLGFRGLGLETTRTEFRCIFEYTRLKETYGKDVTSQNDFQHYATGQHSAHVFRV